MPDVDVSSAAVHETRVAVARAARMMAAAGLVEAFGHVSARLPGGGAAITSTLPLHIARAQDVVVVDAVGTPLAGAVTDVPLEVWLHLAVYAARPDVRAVARGHSPSVVVWGTGFEDLPLLHGLGMLAGRRVRVHDDVALVSDLGRGAAAARLLRDDLALLLRGNGALAVGADPVEAATRLHALEERAAVALRSRSLVPTVPVTSDAWHARARDTPVELRRACRWFAARYDVPEPSATEPSLETPTTTNPLEEDPC